MLFWVDFIGRFIFWGIKVLGLGLDIFKCVCYFILCFYVILGSYVVLVFLVDMWFNYRFFFYGGVTFSEVIYVEN